MSRTVANFDPNNPGTQGPNISTNLHSNYGLSFLNESNIGIDLQFLDGSQVTVPAYYLLSLPVCVIADYFMWSVGYTVPTLGQAPISLAVVTVYEPFEIKNMPPSGALTRLTNVGNTIPVGGNVTQVFNDGNVAPTVVVEGTPSGAPGSELQWNNDGSGLFGGGLIAVSSAGIFTSIPNQAIPLAALQNGPLPVGVIAQVVTNDGKVAGTRVLEATPSGAPQSGFVVYNDGHGQLSSGAIAWDVNGIFTALPTGSVPGAAVNSPLALATVIGTVTNGLSLGNIGGGTSADYGGMSKNGAFTISGVTWWGKTNNYWDGTNDRQSNAGTTAAHQVKQAPNDPSPTYRHGVGTGVDTVITWDTAGFLALAGTSFFTGNSAGTFNHGLGYTPSWIGIICTATNSTFTVGYDSPNATNVHVNVGTAGLNWAGVAMIH